VGNRVLGQVAAAAGALLGAMTLLGCRAGSVPGAPADPAAAQSAGAPGGAHPRIFLTAEVRERLKRKAAAHDPDWDDVRKQADRYAASPVAPYARNEAPRDAISYPYQGAGWLDAILPLGVAYNVTG